MKEVDQKLAERRASALDIVDDDGHDASRGMIAEKTDGLAENFREERVAQVSDGAKAGMIDLGSTQVFRDCFCDIHKNEGKGKDGPNVVDARWEEVIQVDSATAPGNGNKLEGAAHDGRIQDVVDGRSDEQGDEAFRKGHKSQQYHTDDEAKGIRPHVAEQTPKL